MHAPVLARWVGDLAAFMADDWGRHPGVYRPAGGAFSPFTLADVDVALASGFMREPYVEMTRAEDSLSRDAYASPRRIYHAQFPGYADEDKIRACFADGATMLLRRIDHWHNPTAALLADLATELNRSVEAFFFVTPAGKQGLPLHRDDADVLVVQTAGSKKWHVHAGPENGDWAAGPTVGAEPPEVLQTTLRTGEVLYIPRGFAHRATGDGGLSAHLSLTIREAGSAELDDALRRYLADGRMTAPRPVGDEAVLYAADALLSHARSRLDRLIPEDLVRLARQGLIDAMPAPRPELSVVEIATALE